MDQQDRIEQAEDRLNELTRAVIRLHVACSTATKHTMLVLKAAQSMAINDENASKHLLEAADFSEQVMEKVNKSLEELIASLPWTQETEE